MYQQPKTWKDWGILLTAWLSILALGLKAIFNVDITPYVGDIINFFLLTIFIGVSAWGVWKNTYVSKKGKQQQKILNDHSKVRNVSISANQISPLLYQDVLNDQNSRVITGTLKANQIAGNKENANKDKEEGRDDYDLGQR